jgi:hypothetical protein
MEPKVLQPAKNCDKLAETTVAPTSPNIIAYYIEKRRSLLTELKALDRLIEELKQDGSHH